MNHLTWDEIRDGAMRFSKRWQHAANEEAQAQAFQIDFLRVFGIDDPESIGDFEFKVPLEGGHNGYVDYLWKKHIAIEMKSKGKDLAKAYEQLKNYVFHLPAEDIPDLLMVCDFETVVLYHRSTGVKKQFKTRELHKNIRQFSNIAGYETKREMEDQIEVNVKAAEKMAKLHDALKSYGYEGHDLEVYLVRLLFCLFADDTGIFPKQSFLDYMENSREDGSDLSDRIARLFEILNMPDDVRAKRTLLSPELKQFRYINGGLFQAHLPYADFNAKMRQTLLDCCHFDWNEISPAIFGAMFQGVMDKDQRRELGAHYTSEENILKLINPLFLDDLWEELERVKFDPVQLDRFHAKIGQLKFLDPACGCGNFLIVTYRELRRLELELLKVKANSNQLTYDLAPLLKVNVAQFYGIECEDFPCQIAQVGMWLMDHQMNMRVAEQFGMYYARLPLTQSATIVHGNALCISWETVLPKWELNYILGNPPFNGARMMSRDQKKEITQVVESETATPLRYSHMADNLDYVAAWYFKAARYISKTDIAVAFVSTNSICQGEQVAPIWDTLINDYGVEIRFAYRTFKWSNEAKGKAAVHCIIVGFAEKRIVGREKSIYDGEKVTKVKKISPYLVDAPSIFIRPQRKPLCDVPEMKFGSQPRDGGHFVLTPEERLELIRQEPELDKVIRPYVGAEEFINNKMRYCIWLHNESFEVIRQSKILRERIAAVEKFRQESKAKTTNGYARVPAIFAQIAHPYTDYLIVPSVSSERRRYVPIGFINKDTIASNAVQIVPNATLYHFGILTSNVHMAWMRTVAGRLKSDYRYSKELVYNTFVWPQSDAKQIAAIEAAAQGILDERKMHPNASLAELYDPIMIKTTGLEKAHTRLNRIVMQAYGYSVKDT
ncbi:class I SAM-dependent DNA methyltransferase, partial [Eubacteriales bacterium OttesenSCG-928-A19]|nr:class I SAM-dependent DNA methyltransferase [Eubacteriales bacterium OttesenSCG-928-A19]